MLNFRIKEKNNKLKRIPILCFLLFLFWLSFINYLFIYSHVWARPLLFFFYKSRQIDLYRLIIFIWGYILKWALRVNNLTIIVIYVWPYLLMKRVQSSRNTSETNFIYFILNYCRTWNFCEDTWKIRLRIFLKFKKGSH